MASLGLVSAVVGLVFAFWPDLQPDRAPSAQAATLSRPVVDRDATFRQFLARMDQPTRGYTKAQLARRGALLEFRVKITGFKGKDLRLKWELFDKASGRQVNESKAIEITPTNATNAAQWSFWIPLPRRHGPFYAVLDLLEQKRFHSLQLATTRTDPFPGLGTR